MKSIEEREAWACEAGKTRKEAPVPPRLKVRRAGPGPGHGRGMGKRKQRDRDLTAHTHMGQWDREHWGWCRYNFSHTEAL